MSDRRITTNVERGPSVTVTVNGEPLTAYDGETVATALIAAGLHPFRRDKAGRPRAPYCNMGVCYDCLVYVRADDGWRRQRACMTPVRPDMIVLTESPK